MKSRWNIDWKIESMFTILMNAILMFRWEDNTDKLKKGASGFKTQDYI